MRRFYFHLCGLLALFLVVPAVQAQNDLLITGVADGPLTGGIPKAIEFYVLNDVADLSVYGFGSANNGQGTDGIEYVFSGSATAGQYLYAASETDGFTAYFGFAPTFNAGSAASINGDDAVELFYDANGLTVGAATGTTSVVDVFGQLDVSGTGQPWEYLDGWAYRKDATGPDGSTFVVDNWTYSGKDVLDNTTTNATAPTPFPIGTYAATPPTGPVVSFTAGTASGDEGTDVTLTVTLDYPDDVPAGTPVEVSITFDAGSSTATAADFTGPTPATVTFDGTTDGATQDVTISLVSGDGFEGTETAAFTLAVTSGGAEVGTGSATVTINDGDSSPITSIADARAGGGGQTVTVEGVVTRSMGRTTYLQDGDAALVLYQQSGSLFDAIANGDVAEGDSLRVTGTTKDFNGLFELDPISEFTVLSRDNELPEPQFVTLAEIAANGEDYESELLYVLDLTFADAGGTFAASTTYAISDPSDASNMVALRTPRASDTAIAGVEIPSGPALFIGVLGQYTTTGTGGYQLAPVDDDDVLPMPEPMTVAEARAEGVGQEVYFEGTVTRSMGAFTYLQDDTAGLTIRQTSGAFADSVASGAIAPGTVLRVVGTLSEYRGLLQVNQTNATTNDLTSVTIAGTTDVPDPQMVTLSELATNGEDYEAELVTVSGVSITGTGTFSAASTYVISDDSDGSGAVTLRVPNAADSEVDETPIPAQAKVIAIVGQFSSDPATGYQLLVIDSGDIQPTVANEGGAAAENRLAVANPIRGAATIQFSLATPGTATVALFDMLGRRVATLVDGRVDTALQSATLDAGSLSSGVYVLRLVGQDVLLSRTVTVVR